MKEKFAFIRFISELIIYLLVSNIGTSYMGWLGFEGYVAGLFVMICWRYLIIDLEFAIYKAFEKEAK